MLAPLRLSSGWVKVKKALKNSEAKKPRSQEPVIVANATLALLVLFRE
jgi:hypothetical protein